MKPDNPPAILQEGCQFRRNVPQDEGNEQESKSPCISGAFFVLFGLPRRLEILLVKKGETIIERFYEDSKGVFHQRVGDRRASG